MSSKRYHVFISHNSKDKQVIEEKIVKRLKGEAQLEVWFDKPDMIAGEDFEIQTTEALNGCSACAVFVSDNGWRYNHLTEAQIALENRTLRFIPVLLPGASPAMFSKTLGLSEKIMYVDFREGLDDEGEFRLLWRSILGKGRGFEPLLQLDADARRWEKEGKSPNLLYSDRVLTNARLLVRKHSDEATALIWSFIDTSLAMQNARTRRVILGLGFGLMLVSILAVFALIQQNTAISQRATAQAASTQAIEERNVAVSGQLAAQAQNAVGKYPQRSLLLAIEALKASLRNSERGSLAAEDALRQALAGIGGRGLGGHEGSIRAIAISPDGLWLVTGSEDNTARLWNLTSSNPAATPIVLNGHENGIKTISISPDSHWLVTQDILGVTYLWNLRAADPSTTRLNLSSAVYFINAFAFSHDSRWLFTVPSQGNPDGILWDLSTSYPVATSFELAMFARSIGIVAFSPDNQWLVTGLADGAIILWNPYDPRQTAILNGHSDSIRSIAFSSDGHWLVTGSSDKTVRVWDLPSPNVATTPKVLRGQEYPVDTLVISPDNHWLVTKDDHGTARLWQLTAIAAIPIVLNDDDGFYTTITVTAVSISPDSRWLIAVIDDGIAAILWDLTARDLFATTKILYDFDDPVAFSPDSHWLITGSKDNTGRIYDLTNSEPFVSPVVLRGHEDTITALAISSDSRLVATASVDATARLWALNDPDQVAAPIILHESGGPVAISPDSHWLATSNGNAAHLYDLTTPDMVTTPIVLSGHQDYISAITFSTDNHWLVTGSWDHTARLWDLTATDPTAISIVFREHQDGVRTVAISPDSHWLATGGAEGVTRLWDLTDLDPTNTSIALYGYPYGSVTAVAFSPNNRWLASNNVDTYLWDPSSWNISASPIILPSTGVGTDIAFSLDNHWLVTTNTSDAILWNLRAFNPAANPIILLGHEWDINDIAISSDSRWLATGGVDATARLWDLTEQDPTATSILLRSHEAAVRSVAFSPDNRWLATGSADGTARLWDLAAPNPAAESIVLRIHEFGPSISWDTSVAFSSDGHWLVVSGGSIVHLWNRRSDELIDVACYAAGRNLTRAEWTQYMGDEPYRKTCEEWEEGE